MSSDSHPAGTEKKPRGGRRFEAGQSGNPTGRPNGTRSSLYAALDAAAAEDLPEIITALRNQAKLGDVRAAELIFRRVWPERKGRALAFTLPTSTGAAGVAETMQAVTTAMAAGELTPDEASAIANVVEINRRAIVTEDHEQRLQAIEQGNRKP